MRTAYAMLVVLSLVSGCSQRDTPTNDRLNPSALAETTAGESSQVNHETEQIALSFIDLVQAEAFSESVADFAVDSALPPQDRINEFRNLEKFIKAQKWQPWLTSIEIVNGNEDSATCYLRGSDGNYLVLLLGFRYDIKQWQLDAYEMEGRTFARPANESYEEYVTRSVAEEMNGATPYRSGVREDGKYFIDHSQRN